MFMNSTVIEGLMILTHSCLESFPTNVFWTEGTFWNNFGNNHEFEKHLKESCEFVSDQYFVFNYFLEIVLVIEISSEKY